MHIPVLSVLNNIIDINWNHKRKERRNQGMMIVPNDSNREMISSFSPLSSKKKKGVDLPSSLSENESENEKGKNCTNAIYMNTTGHSAFTSSNDIIIGTVKTKKQEWFHQKTNYPPPRGVLEKWDTNSNDNQRARKQGFTKGIRRSRKELNKNQNNNGHSCSTHEVDKEKKRLRRSSNKAISSVKFFEEEKSGEESRNSIRIKIISKLATTAGEDDAIIVRKCSPKPKPSMITTSTKISVDSDSSNISATESTQQRELSKKEMKSFRRIGLPLRRFMNKRNRTEVSQQEKEEHPEMQKEYLAGVLRSYNNPLASTEIKMNRVSFLSPHPVSSVYEYNKFHPGLNPLPPSISIEDEEYGYEEDIYDGDGNAYEENNYHYATPQKSNDDWYDYNDYFQNSYWIENIFSPQSMFSTMESWKMM